ncbi:hypothetical protein E3N88_25141 [Mikania micrantha]|uniref:Protein kinase domain-containing protein n=1 Tax=Mikania micrantha TaxID=192012 RepID=A0A5N6N590_9ASTR|nr:hypothetical protein E3N88_25141 [Mikania micrantha]
MIEIVQTLENVLRLQQEFEKALFLQQVFHGSKGKQEDKADSYKVKNLEHMKIPLKQIKLATHDFHDDFKIGRGGYGKVYKADLFHFDVQKYYFKNNIYQKASMTKLLGYRRRKSTVAVKRLDRRYGQGTAEFLQEISVLPYFRHQNLIMLVGFCDEDHERILVYEYASNGSIDQYISSIDSRNNYAWAQYLQICLDAARGLQFLHDGVGEHHRIIHRDIKSSNILLGQNWVGKISDFGLSRIGPANLQATFVMTQVAGTLEYVDPQYNKTGMLTKESDVYSFGVVLFEVLSGRLAYFPRLKDDQEYLPHTAKRCFEQNKLEELINPRLKNEFEKRSFIFDGKTLPDSISIFAAIAYKCIQGNRDDRPIMSNIVEELEKALRSQVQGVEALRIPLETIRFATQDFSEILEQEGYVMVYKGVISHSKGHKAVIVKRQDHKVGSYENDFYKDIASLYSFSQKNVIPPILGFCEDASERIVVFEHMVNGSLKEHVKNSSLTWKQRLKICIDAARGLACIHSGSDSQYSIHGNIKSSSILIDNDWNAVISDFIIAKGVITLGYCDPLYARTGILTPKSDVYSFGVVLFEMLSGRLAIETVKTDQQQPFHGDHESEYLPHTAKRCFEQDKLDELINPRLKTEFEKRSFIFDGKTLPDSISIFAAIAYKCLQGNRDDRPTMSNIVEELEKALRSQVSLRLMINNYVFFKNVQGVEALRIPLETIRFATQDFSEILEQEGYVMVYKGVISHSKGPKAVIVKRQDHKVGSYENDFYKDIASLYSFSQKNVIPPILGFCEDASERIVVFEHMVNGSLKEHVKNSSLTWKQRLKICIDVARGLACIHSGSDSQYSIHGNIKSSSILIDNDWNAVISDFIIAKGVITLGYCDPLYARTGILTPKSDVYSFGVVLFEMLSGRLAIETVKTDQQQPFHGDHESGPVIFLSQLATQCFKNKRLEEFIFCDIKEQIDANSLAVFFMIAYQCLQEETEDRPTMEEVVKELEKAFECLDEWEWKQKLPEDYKKIISMSKFPLASINRSKDLYSLFSSGILLQNEKMWFSIGMNGVRNEMVSARLFSFKNVKWRSIRKSRFSKVAKISDNLNLDIKIQIKPQLLTLDMMYGAYLVFKFCNPRKVSSQPLYVNLKYKMAGEPLNAYFAKWRDGGERLMVELFRFWNNNETINCDILLESFSHYYCGNWGIFVEGLEFNAIHSLEECKDNNRLNVGKNVPRILKPDLYIECLEIIKRSENNIQNAPKEELSVLLYNGILIDKGEKIFSLSKVNGKKCHMLRAKAVIWDSSNAKCYNIKPQAQSRFEDVVEILLYHEFRIKCDIETQLLSSDTSYACFLVFKLSEKCHGLKCPVKARDLLPANAKQRTKIICFRTPSAVNLNKIKWIPEQREDGWMEVIIWETISDRNNIPMDLKLITFQGTMSGLIISGIEFRPMACNNLARNRSGGKQEAPTGANAQSVLGAPTCSRSKGRRKYDATDPGMHLRSGRPDSGLPS